LLESQDASNKTISDFKFQISIQQLETKKLKNKNCGSNFEKPETRNQKLEIKPHRPLLMR